MEGQQWRNTEALLWMIAHKLDVLDQRLVWHKGSRKAKAKWPKWRQFPWVRGKQQIGDRGDASSEQVEAYLRHVGPGGDAK